jgi:hypothetical protein
MVRIMTLIRPVWVALVLAFSFLVGCASTPDTISSGAAHQIDPIRHATSTSTGWLVARVDGNPRDIEYYINGVRLEPEEPIEWWKDAFIRVQLRPGLYDLEGRYLVRAFAGSGIEYRIVTRDPVEVRPGLETELEARLEKDWRGVPAAETAYFVPVTAERRARQAEAQARQAQPVAAPAGEDRTPTPANLSATSPALAADHAAQGPDNIVIRGNATRSGAGSMVLQDAQQPTAVDAASDDIVIHGPGVTPTTPNTTAATPPSPSPSVTAPGAAGAAVALSVPTSEPSEPAEPVTLEGAEEFGITVSIESEPPGATVLVDDQSVGRTPVAVRLDPRADHIVEFTHDGCGDYVRLLSSNSWREGRDTTVKVQLYCD